MISVIVLEVNISSMRGMFSHQMKDPMMAKIPTKITTVDHLLAKLK
jgi:hypothetical protein